MFPSKFNREALRLGDVGSTDPEFRINSEWRTYTPRLIFRTRVVWALHVCRFCITSQLLVFEYYLRISKILLTMKSLKAAILADCLSSSG